MGRRIRGISRAGWWGLSVCFTGAFAAPRAHATEIGVGLMGTIGGNFQDKPDRGPTDPDTNPGFGGLTAGGGFLLDARFIDLVGVEVDALRTSDKGNGTITFNGVSSKLTIGQGAWHVPILAKLTIPSPVVAPTFFVGPELVLPSSGDAKLDGPLSAAVTLKCKADTYWMITGGGGAEIKVPLPILDLRIPITVRVSYNPGLSSKYGDRTKNSVDATFTHLTASYDSAWKYAVNFTAGAALYF